MEVEYSKEFFKDLKLISNEGKKLTQVMNKIEEVKKASKIDELPSIKKGHKNAFRLRVGDLRIGFHLEENIVYFHRCLKRKEIFKKFP